MKGCGVKWCFEEEGGPWVQNPRQGRPLVVIDGRLAGRRIQTRQQTPRLHPQ